MKKDVLPGTLVSVDESLYLENAIENDVDFPRTSWSLITKDELGITISVGDKAIVYFCRSNSLVRVYRGTLQVHTY